MSGDIADRIIDYLQRQIAALHDVECDWLPWASGEGLLSDDDLSAIERLQRRRAQALDPLQAEFRSLWKEWERSDRSSTNADEARRLARDAAAAAARVRELEEQLRARVLGQMKRVAAEGDFVRCGRKVTRDYGAGGANDASYIDRNA